MRMRAVVPVLAALLAALSARAGAQIPYLVFDDATEVASLDFRFTDGRTLSPAVLAPQLELSEPPALSGLRRAFSFLPFVPDVEPHPFGVLPLQRDVVRLRRIYAQEGFIGTDVRYEVEFDEEENTVAVQFIVDEGRPVMLRDVEYETAAGGAPSDVLPADLQDAWRGFARSQEEETGGRLTAAFRRQQIARVTDWYRNRGYPFADSRGTAAVDSAAGTAVLTVVTDAGPRARVDTVDVQGNTSVSDDVVRRTFDVDSGDIYAARAVDAGQRRLFALDLFRLVLAETPDGQPRDSTVRVRVRLEESPPRLVTGEIGYSSVGGVALRGEFLHRNFTGGARTLRVSAAAETGLLPLGERAARDYRMAVSYRRPFFFHPRLSLNVAPFGQYRDDLTDRSWQAGVESSLIYELGPFRYLTLQHRFTTREVLDFRLGASSAAQLDALIERVRQGALDSLESRYVQSVFALSATIGRWDPANPTDALQARPSLEITTPSGVNTIEYLQLDLPLFGWLPLSDRYALGARARIGRVFPYGNTFDGDSIGQLESNRLRDVVLAAGGTGSVRGWGNGLLGPKFPELEVIEDTEGDTVGIGTEGYAPTGGLARALGSIELTMPFPGLGESWGTHAFLDAGRVWTPGDRVTLGEEDAQRWFFGAGAGIDYATIAGPLRLSVGYKLNPSPLDLRDPSDVLEALLEDRPVTSAPTDWKRRLHIHVSIGQRF